jgi:hypothetical protein|nr:MAG TPA: hypothetical protein [Caudoviricetes sp.]
MNIFLKFLPYLLIIALGAGIYGGFRYMSNELSITKEQNQTLIIKNNELQNQIKTISTTANVTVEQLEQIRKNEKESLKYISETNLKIDALELNEDSNIILMKINNYEVCMAKNSLNPEIKCELNIK